jgi:hypothetical protein
VRFSAPEVVYKRHVSFIIAEARDASFVAYMAIGALVGGSVAVLAYDSLDIKSSAVFLTKNIRTLFFT